MKKRGLFLPAVLLGALCFSCFLHGVTPSAQWSMQNNTKQTLDFYIDDVLQCTALSRGFCTSQVKPGAHILKAKSRDGKFEKKSETLEIKEGESKVWVVEEPETEPGVV